MHIRPFEPQDEGPVVALWERCGLTRPWNQPRRDIRRKLEVQPELFLVGELEGRVVATAMAGYDGHRGWIYYLCVDPEHRRMGLGRAVMAEAERRLVAAGCPKVNLQVRGENRAAVEFYERIGYDTEDRVSFGRRLIPDDS